MVEVAIIFKQLAFFRKDSSKLNASFITSMSISFICFLIAFQSESTSITCPNVLYILRASSEKLFASEINIFMTFYLANSLQFLNLFHRQY